MDQIRRDLQVSSLLGLTEHLLRGLGPRYKRHPPTVKDLFKAGSSFAILCLEIEQICLRRKEHNTRRKELVYGLLVIFQFYQEVRCVFLVGSAIDRVRLKAVLFLKQVGRGVQNLSF